MTEEIENYLRKSYLYEKEQTLEDIKDYLQQQFPDAIITIENGNFAVRGSISDVKAIQDIIESFYTNNCQ